jgi:membrane protein DedA with SNARE-associated domain
VGTWVSLGYLAGSHIDAIYHDITRYSYYALIALAVVLAAYIARHILRRRRRRTPPARRQAKASQAQARSKSTTRNGR